MILPRFGLLVALSALSGIAQPGAPDHLAAARAAETTGDFAAAEHEYQESLKLVRDPEVLQRLGLVRHLQNKFAEAVPALQEAVRLNPRLWGAQLFLGIDLYRTNQFEKALQHLQVADRLQPQNPEIRFWLGATHVALKQNFQGLEILEDLLREEPENVELVKLLAQTYAAFAAQFLNRVGERYPETAAGYQVHGQALEFEGSYEPAIEAYRTALSLQPGRAGIHAAIARILLAEGKQEEAARELQKEPTKR